jgi:excinuclease ABC subunit B
MTGSIKKAIEETERRREKQIAYNKKHNITPKTIIKKIQDITDQMKSEHQKTVSEILKIDTNKIDPSTSSGRANIAKLIRSKEKQMNNAVKILDFETAALLRDEIAELLKLEEKNKKKQIKNPKNVKDLLG